MKRHSLLVSSLVVPSVVVAVSFVAPACSSSSTASPVVDGSTQSEASISHDASGSTPDAAGADASESDAPESDGAESDAPACDAGSGAACPLTYYDPSWCASPWDEDAAVADGGDTWASYMHGFFENYCVECHHLGGEGDPTTSANLDFRTQADPVMNAPTIRCGIIPADASPDPSWHCGGNPPPGQFPISDSHMCNQKPSSAGRWRVVTWIEAGSP
jgi:hypothetical protein